MAVYATLAEARTAYLASVDYADSGDVSKARDFRSACRALLVLLPAEVEHGAGNTAQRTVMSVESVQTQLQAVEAWLGSADTAAGGGGGIRHVDLSYYRD